MRPDAVPFWFLRHSSKLLGVFLKPLRVLFELLGSLLGGSWGPLGASWAILGRLGAKLCGLGATFGALDFLFLFGAILGAKRVPKEKHFGSQKVTKMASNFDQTKLVIC